MLLTLCSAYVSMSFMDNSNATPSSSAPGPRDSTRECGGDSARADRAAAGRQVRLLERLAVAGMGLARVAAARVAVPAEPGETADIADRVITFGQVARAIRQTIGLEVKLRAERRGCEADPAADAATARQLRLLQELAEISLAVADAPANLGAVPIFLKVSRAVRRTVGLAVGLRNSRRAPDKGAAAAAPEPPAGEPPADPAVDQSPDDPVADLANIASTLGETLDAFDEYYRFLKVPVAKAVALIFETLGVPVETGEGLAESTDPDPASATAAAAGEDVVSDSDRERRSDLVAPRLDQPPAGGNRGPP
jgi:hypothetical protein